MKNTAPALSKTRIKKSQYSEGKGLIEITNRKNLRPLTKKKSALAKSAILFKLAIRKAFSAFQVL
jgi:hypothetical protein